MRDKARELCELLQDPIMLEREREFARQTREKLGTGSTGSSSYSGSGAPTSMSSASMTSGTGMGGSSAAPASGKYGGFGSEDIKRLGYN